MPVPPTHEIGGTGPSNFGREPLPEWQRRAALVAANRSSFCVSAAFVGQLSSTPSTTMPLPVPVDPGSDSAAKWVRWARPRRTMSLPRLPLSTVNTACVRRHGGRRHGRAQHPARSAIDPGPSVRIPARSQCRIGPIAVRSWTTTLRDQGSLTTVRPDVASIVPRSRHSYSQGPRRWLVTVSRQLGAGTADACSIDAIRVGSGRVSRLAGAFASPSCMPGCRPERPLFRRVWRGPPVPQRRRRPSSPARLSLAFLARQEARLWPSSAVLRPFVHPIAQRRWGPRTGCGTVLRPPDRPPVEAASGGIAPHEGG